jgi:hypothetical protein
MPKKKFKKHCTSLLFLGLNETKLLIFIVSVFKESILLETDI